jgi:hypothetical protein
VYAEEGFYLIEYNFKLPDEVPPRRTEQSKLAVEHKFPNTPKRLLLLPDLPNDRLIHTYILLFESIVELHEKWGIVLFQLIIQKLQSLTIFLMIV